MSEQTVERLDNTIPYRVCDELWRNRAILFLSNSVIFGLYVDPGYRGQGLARKLLEKVIEDHGHEELYLDVEPFADHSLSIGMLQDFYSKFGFEPYFNSNDPEAHWMMRERTPKPGSKGGF